MSTDELFQRALLASCTEGERLYTPAEVLELADAMWQLLDDMGKKGQSVCMLAKIDARIAYEPFRDKSEPEYEDWLTYAEAEAIRADYEKQR